MCACLSVCDCPVPVSGVCHKIFLILQRGVQRVRASPFACLPSSSHSPCCLSVCLCSRVWHCCWSCRQLAIILIPAGQVATHQGTLLLRAAPLHSTLSPASGLPDNDGVDVIGIGAAAALAGADCCRLSFIYCHLRFTHSSPPALLPPCYS